MLRGGFANPRLRNLLVPQVEGGVTKLMPDGEVLPIFEAAARYAERGTPAVIVAGKNYGVGSARDWAAKVTRLLGVRAVIAGGFERIHRANLISFGVLPLEIPGGSLRLNGDEELDLLGLPEALHRGGSVTLIVRNGNKVREAINLRCCIETEAEEKLLRFGGLFAKLLSETAAAL
jgi:aconitate hydratase